ncbi:cleavage and polyadenylation specificity factor subunit 6-like isoform X1 [Vombatus ursinus]|uniref:cleavage and polyadenylation specificity factor subunit 6-like isoform X1 n=1 Tax=Vombatus ursinus TaxID=29139 RepID=UPI000FFD8A31|nr:cleavage and polyadenylation specificity factor subunit 6-like isoform X1 [Vombatus ursinus]
MGSAGAEASAAQKGGEQRREGLSQTRGPSAQRLPSPYSRALRPSSHPHPRLRGAKNEQGPLCAPLFPARLPGRPALHPPLWAASLKPLPVPPRPSTAHPAPSMGTGDPYDQGKSLFSIDCQAAAREDLLPSDQV